MNITCSNSTQKNRPINPARVNEWIEKFKDGEFFLKEFPVTINDEFLVLDGQHRFHAAKALGLPIYFRVTNGLTIDDVAKIQTNSGWTTSEYLHSFVEQKIYDYIELKRFRVKYGFSISQCARLLSGTSNTGLKKLGFY